MTVKQSVIHEDTLHEALGVIHGDTLHEALGVIHGDTLQDALGVIHGDTLQDALGVIHRDTLQEALGVMGTLCIKCWVSCMGTQCMKRCILVRCDCSNETPMFSFLFFLFFYSISAGAVQSCWRFNSMFTKVELTRTGSTVSMMSK